MNFTYGGKTPLMWASLQSCDKSAEALIRAGADVNVTCDQDNATALFWAAEREYDWTKTAECVKLLLRFGARINVRNKKGRNALEESLSKKSGNVGDIDLILFAAGETVNVVKHHGFLFFLLVTCAVYQNLDKKSLGVKQIDCQA